MKLIKLFSILLFPFLFIACQGDSCLTKASFLKNFEEFYTNYVSENNDNEKAEEQTKEMARFEFFILKCHKKFKKDLKLKERQEFWAKAIEAYAKLKNNTFSDLFGDNPEELEQYMQTELEELIKESGDEFAEEITKKLKEELPKLIDNIVDKIEDFGEELKKLLEN